MTEMMLTSELQDGRPLSLGPMEPSMLEEEIMVLVWFMRWMAVPAPKNGKPLSGVMQIRWVFQPITLRLARMRLFMSAHRRDFILSRQMSNLPGQAHGQCLAKTLNTPDGLPNFNQATSSLGRLPRTLAKFSRVESLMSPP